MVPTSEKERTEDKLKIVCLLVSAKDYKGKVTIWRHNIVKQLNLTEHLLRSSQYEVTMNATYGAYRHDGGENGSKGPMLCR